MVKALIYSEPPYVAHLVDADSSQEADKKISSHSLAGRDQFPSMGCVGGLTETILSALAPSLTALQRFLVSVQLPLKNAPP